MSTHHYTGKLCELHPELNGLRDDRRGECVKCRRMTIRATPSAGDAKKRQRARMRGERVQKRLDLMATLLAAHASAPDDVTKRALAARYNVEAIYLEQQGVEPEPKRI